MLKPEIIIVKYGFKLVLKPHEFSNVWEELGFEPETYW
jgi:hypothetical protein